MNEIIEIFEQYKGDIEQEYKYASIISTNTIRDFWGEDHKVKCQIRVMKKDNGEYLISYDEFTYSILGGGARGGTLKEVEETLKFLLERYHFEKKDKEQTRLFE